MYRLLFLFFLSSAAVADPATVEAFVKGCTTSSNWSEKLCLCVGKDAKQQLSPKGFEYLVVAYKDKDEAIKRLGVDIPVADMLTASRHILTSSQNCLRQGN